MFNKLSTIKKLLGIDDSYIAQRGLEHETIEPEQDDIEVIKLDKLFIEKDEERVEKKPKSFKVVPIIREEDDYIFIDDKLPKIPFSWINSGCRGAGKSTTTLFLIDILDTYFDEIIIFSPTLELDIKYKMLFEKLDRDFEVGINVFYEYSESVLSRILTKIKKANKNKPFKDKAATLIIFEDIICSLPKQQRKTIFNKLLLNNRHYNVSIIINSQSFKLFDTSLRKNCSQICLWRTDNMSELRNYYEEYSALLGNTSREQRENFIKLYNYATDEPHSFLYINTHSRPNIFYKNLDEQIDVAAICAKPIEFYSPEILGKNKKKCPKGKDICNCPEEDLVITDKDDK